MNEAADELEFERAARLRDRISALSAIQGQQGINPQTVEEADVFAIARGGRAVLRRGVLLPHLPELGQSRLFPRADGRSIPREVLDAFLAQFYDDKPRRASCCSRTRSRSASCLPRR